MFELVGFYCFREDGTTAFQSLPSRLPQQVSGREQSSAPDFVLRKKKQIPGISFLRLIGLTMPRLPGVDGSRSGGDETRCATKTAETDFPLEESAEANYLESRGVSRLKL